MRAKTGQIIERMIVKRIVLDAVKAGYALNINNGGDTNEMPNPSVKVKNILDNMFATSDERLLFYKDNKMIGWVYLVYGNDGPDVVNDYTTNLESVMTGANKLANRYN